MKKIILFLLPLLTVFSCSEKESNLIITGEIEGLKKGTLYLQKIKDTSLYTIDSVKVEGNSQFTFKTFIESPQVLYLYLKKVDNSKFDDRISFFAEPGKMSITTELKYFTAEAEITGSENQEKYLEYEKMMSNFNNKRLDLIKADLLAQKEGNQEKIDSLTTRFENLIKRRYLYTINFALNNKDLELSPYLAISEVYDANIKYLDTIYSSLSPKVRNSKYGKSLEQLLEDRRAVEEVQPEK